MPIPMFGQGKAPAAPEEAGADNMTGAVVAQVLKELYKNGALRKDVADDHTGVRLHGAGGLFNAPGLEQPIISLHVRSRGLGQVLNAYPTRDTTPFFGFITGFGAESGDEPDYPCDPAPTGYMKSGTLKAKFGYIQRDTNTIRLPDVLEKLHRGDFTDLQLVNSIINPDSVGTLMPADINESDLLDNVVTAEQVIAGVNMERKLSKMVWNGNAAVQTEGYAEFPGLDVQIATGQVDAETGVAMPSADSLVLSFGGQEVGVADIVEIVSEAEDYNYNLAEDTGVDVMGVLVCRPQLFRALTAAWPVQYNSDPYVASLTGDTNARYIIDGRTMVDQRDAFRKGLWLPINGRNYNVVLDTGITELNSSDEGGPGLDQFSSSLYFVPLSVSGMPATYWQYLDYTGLAGGTSKLHGMETWWTDGGRFLWSYDGKYTCFTLKMETKPRIVLRTPHLAWKIDDIVYRRTYAPHRSDDPASDYWKDGGVSIRSLGATSYAVWGDLPQPL